MMYLYIVHLAHLVQKQTNRCKHMRKHTTHQHSIVAISVNSVLGLKQFWHVSTFRVRAVKYSSSVRSEKYCKWSVWGNCQCAWSLVPGCINKMHIHWAFVTLVLCLKGKFLRLWYSEGMLLIDHWRPVIFSREELYSTMSLYFPPSIYVTRI